MQAAKTDSSMEQTSGANHLPLVSVVIPVFNDRDSLILCLGALGKQEYAGPLEIIVVNNGAPGDLTDLMEQFVNVVFIDEPKAGSYAARNAGIARASGTVLAFTDADCLPYPLWIVSGVRTLLAIPRCGFVGGRVQLVPRNPDRASVSELFDAMFGIPQRWYVEGRHFAATANMFTRCNVIQKVGAFRYDLRSSGDVEWGQRVFAADYSAVYDDAAVVRHPARDYAASIKKLRRTVAGERDRKPDWKSCVRWSLKALLPPHPRAMLHILRNGDFPTTPGQKLALLWLLFYLRWRGAIERMRLQFVRDESPRS
jgi:glycosyltransferase involved in cell wall biosynthesis